MEEKKPEKKFNLFVDKYETIRKMLRQIFIFGCYDRTQGAEFQKISERKYSNEIKRVLSFFPQRISRARNFEGKRVNHFPFSRYSGDKNYLWLSYCTKTFSPQDLNLYIAILQILDAKNFQKVSCIKEKILIGVIADSDTEENIFEPMLRNRLQDMAEIGILERRQNEYRLAEDILSELNSAELLNIYKLLDFYRDALPLSSLGYNLQWLIREHIKFWRNENFNVASAFAVEDTFLQNILNDEIFYKLIVAIEGRNFIKIQFAYSDKIVEVVPLKIILDRQYGRQYLFYIDDNGAAFIRRLDAIINLEIVEDKFYTRADFLDAEKLLENVWCAALNFSHGREKKILIEADFEIEDNFDWRVLNRLECEKHIGKIEKLNDKHWLFSVEVTEPRELIPFIRSFGKYAKVRPSDAHNLSEILASNFENLKTAYNNLERWKSSNIENKSARSEIKSPPVSNNPPKFFCEYRNKFFIAVQEIYNSLLTREKNFSRQEFIDFLCKKTFAGAQIKNLATEISEYGGTITKFSLFQNSNGEINLNSQEDSPKLPLLLTTPEKRYLRTLLEYPLFSNLVGENLRAKLLKLLKVPPLNLREIIIERNFWNENFDGVRLQENLKIIFDAIDAEKFLSYTNCASGGREFLGTCQPVKIIYSPYMHKFYLDAVILNGAENSLKRMVTANLKNLESVDSSEKVQTPFKDLQESCRKVEKLKLLIKAVSGYHDVERCFMLFSTHEKSGWYDAAQNLYHMEISFYSFEIPAIIRKILSLGAAVVVLEPDYIREFVMFKAGISPALKELPFLHSFHNSKNVVRSTI